jgi:hypothetical protein
MAKFLAFFCALLTYCTPLYAQELHLLGGILSDGINHDQSYSWSLEYMQSIKERLAFSVSWVNEGHFTILSLTVSLIAVLIPLLFMGDVVGRLFREFAITLGVTILISAVVSLTLTPMMCSRLIKHTPAERQGRF